MTDEITVYEPDNSLKKGYLHIFKEIYGDIKKNRWLTYQLFKRDFLAAYRQSFIGIFWAFIIPIISVLTFIVLDQSGVLNIGVTSVPYPIFAILGMAYWQLFSTGIIASSNSLVAAGPMIVKIRFSKKSLVIASFGQSLIAFLVQFVLVIILFFVLGVQPHISILLAVVFMVPIILFALGLGFLLAILNGIVRDAGNLISIFMTFLMFLTPILYVKPDSGILLTLTTYNPIYYLVTAPREFMLTGVMTEWLGFTIACILSVVIFLICLVVFHITEYRIAERV